MKKLLITGAFVLFVAGAVQAQLSAQAGLNNVTIKADFSGFGSVSDSELGFFFGAGYEMEIDEKFSIEPAALLSLVSDLTSLYIPVMGKYDLGDGFKVTAGPQFNLLLEDTEDGALGVDLGFGGEYSFADDWFAFARYAFQVARGGDFGDVYNINTLTLGVGKRFN